MFSVYVCALSKIKVININFSWYCNKVVVYYYLNIVQLISKCCLDTARPLRWKAQCKMNEIYRTLTVATTERKMKRNNTKRKAQGGKRGAVAYDSQWDKFTSQTTQLMF